MSTPTRQDEAQGAGRPLRADARRNRERVVEAAATCLGRDGMAAQMEDVARSAGVGVGTVYRHFPTKEALVEAIGRRKFETLIEIAREVDAEGPPGDAFERFLWRTAERHAEDRALAQMSADLDEERAPEVFAELRERVGALIDQAQAAGTLRADFSADDMPMLGCSIGHAVRTFHEHPDRDWRRVVGYLIDGLRPRPA